VRGDRFRNVNCQTAAVLPLLIVLLLPLYLFVAPREEFVDIHEEEVKAAVDLVGQVDYDAETQLDLVLLLSHLQIIQYDLLNYNDNVDQLGINVLIILISQHAQQFNEI